MKRYLLSFMGLLLVGCAHAGVTFSNSTSTSTFATFSSSGTYVITFTASDGITSSAKVLNILVSNPALAAILTVPPASGIGGDTVDLTVNFSTGSVAIAALQFSITGGSGFTFGTVTAGPATLAAGKSVSSSTTTNGENIIIAGINQTSILSGTVATIPITLSPTLASGNQALTLSNLVASDSTGAGTPMNGLAGSILVTANQSPTVTISGPSAVTLPSNATLSATAIEPQTHTPVRPLTFQWSGQ